MQTETKGRLVNASEIFMMLFCWELSVNGAYTVSYRDLNPVVGYLYFASDTQQVGYAYAGPPLNTDLAAIWSGPSGSVVDLSPPGALGSYAYGATTNQQVGAVWFDSYLDHPVYAALWNGSATSFRNLMPPRATYSQAFATSGSQQVGEVDYGPPSWHAAAALWHGTAESFVDLSPPGYDAIAWAVAGGQQAGVVYFGGGPHAAIWSGTAASFRDLNPPGSTGSALYGTTGSQQVGANQLGAGLWSGTPESFVSLAPPDGNYYSVAVATVGTAQAGYIQSTNSASYRHAFLWFGSAAHALDLHTNLPSDLYRESEARSLWTDGTNLIVGGDVVTWANIRHPLVWTLTPQECQLVCPTNIFVCNDLGQCGAVVYYAPPPLSNCSGSSITFTPPSGSFFSVGTNTVVCTAFAPRPGQQTNTCAFMVAVRDCEPPSIQSIAASPAILWPPNHKMRPVALQVSATDNCRVARTRILQVTSNQPGSSSDWELTGDLTVNLRAERFGNGADRIYSIIVECSDDAGNTAIALASVTVPH